MIFPDLAATVGNTPMVELARMTAGLPGRVLAKLEMRNPCGSVKDRVAVALIEDAERRGVLRPGMTLIEATGREDCRPTVSISMWPRLRCGNSTVQVDSDDAGNDVRGAGGVAPAFGRRNCPDARDFDDRRGRPR